MTRLATRSYTNPYEDEPYKRVQGFAAGAEGARKKITAGTPGEGGLFAATQGPMPGGNASQYPGLFSNQPPIMPEPPTGPNNDKPTTPIAVKPPNSAKGVPTQGTLPNNELTVPNVLTPGNPGWNQVGIQSWVGKDRANNPQLMDIPPGRISGQNYGTIENPLPGGGSERTLVHPEAYASPEHIQKWQEYAKQSNAVANQPRPGVPAQAAPQGAIPGVQGKPTDPFEYMTQNEFEKYKYFDSMAKALPAGSRERDAYNNAAFNTMQELSKMRTQQSQGEFYKAHAASVDPMAQVERAKAMANLPPELQANIAQLAGKPAGDFLPPGVSQGVADIVGKSEAPLRDVAQYESYGKQLTPAEEDIVRNRMASLSQTSGYRPESEYEPGWFRQALAPANEWINRQFGSPVTVDPMEQAMQALNERIRRPGIKRLQPIQ